MEVETKTTTVPTDTDAGISTIVYEKEPESKGDLEVEVEAKEPAKLPEFIANLDICFLLDCTGSMQSYIDRARNKIKDIIEEVKVQHPGSEIQVGIVGYRDVQDSKRFEIHHFSSDLPSAKLFLDGIRADGGGDTPEDVNGAFQQALFKMEWSGQAKMIVHIADAPCHGKDYHTCDDNHPTGHKDDMAWDKIFKEIVDKHIDYLFLQIHSHYTDKMFNKFKEMAEGLGAAANGVLFKQEPISNADAKAATAATSLFTAPATTSSFIPSTAIFAKKKRAPRKEKTEKKEKKEKKARKSRASSKKAASPSPSRSASPSESKSKSRSKAPKKEKGTRKRKESEEKKEVDSDWVAPTHWTRSKYRDYIEHGGKEMDKSGYWTIPETGEVSVVEPRKRSGKKASGRKPSVSKERSEKRGRKSSTKRRTSKDKERSEERTKKATKGKSKKGDMLVENPLPKRAFIAPKHRGKSSSKIPATMPVMPTSFAGMSAMDEQEYFAKLLSKEMSESLHRRKDAMK